MRQSFLARGLVCAQVHRLLLPSRLFSVSACEETETYSPAAILIASNQRCLPRQQQGVTVPRAAANPINRLAVEIKPSLAPSTVA